MGLLGLTLCGTCSLNNNGGGDDDKDEVDMINELIKAKTQIIVMKTEFLEKQLDDTKTDLRRDLSDVQINFKLEIKELKTDLLTLLNFMNTTK